MKVQIFKNALLWSCYFFFIGYTHLSHANTDQPIFLIDTLFAESVLDTQYLYILPDSNNIFSPETIQEQPFSPLSQFSKSTIRAANTGYWTKLIVHNQLEIAQEYWLAIASNTHRSYGYQIQASGEILSSQTGFNMPHKEKTIQAIKRKQANYLPLKLQAGEKVIFYIKNEYAGFRTGLKDVLRIETPLNVQFNQIKERGYQNFFNGFFYAILTLLFIYCFFYAYYAKEPFAIYLGLYCFTYCIYFLNSEGYLYAISEIKNHPVLFDLVSLNLINLAIIFECLFIQHFLSLKTIFPKWNKFFKGFIISQVLVLFIASAYYLGTSNILPPIIIVSLFQLLFLITRPFFLFKVWQLPETKVRIFAYAWFVGFLFSMIALVNIFFPFFNPLIPLKLGVGGFISIMLIGLSYNAAKSRTDKLRFEKKNIQQLLELEQQQFQQIAIEQEKGVLQVRTKELQALDQLKSHFFANVSHELRTPLTLLLSPIQTVLKSNNLSPRNDSLLRLAQQNGKRLLQLTNEILDLNKLEAGKLELQLSNVVLFNFLKRIIAAFQSHAESAKIELIFQYELDKYLQVKLDKKKTETILINLLSNALKFTPAKGKVTIIAKDYQKYLQVSVQDTGRGIHPDDLPHIFNRFFQTKQTNRQAEGGTGIGLALSQQLVKLMDGSLQVTSELNHGANFILNIPHIEVMAKLSDEAARLVLDNQLNQNEQTAKVGDTLTPIAIGTPTLDPQHQNGQAKNQTILLVEDNHDLRKYIQSLLLPHYKVSTAENGQVALDYLATNPKPNLIISDIMMPLMNGYLLLQTLKTSEQYRFLPVIMLTALAGATDKLKALRIGVDDYILKPFSEEELLARVHNLIKHAILRRDFLQTETSPSPTAVNTSATEKESVSIEVSPTDQAWLTQLEHITLEKLGNFNLSVEQLASEMAQSRWQFNRHLKGLTGLTARQYLLETRLNQARTLLEQGNHTSVKAVVYTVGIKDLQHFSRQFKERFGKSPSEYLIN